MPQAASLKRELREGERTEKQNRIPEEPCNHIDCSMLAVSKLPFLIVNGIVLLTIITGMLL